MIARHLFVAAAVALALCSPALAHEHFFYAVFSGADEVPPNGSPGAGSAFVTLDLDLITMRVQAEFHGLLGNVTEAHVHLPTAVPGAGTAGIATELPTLPGFPSGVTSGLYDQTIDLTVASSYNPAFITASGGTVSDALNALIFGMEAGKAYLNIRTESFPDGEIRGFLIELPEPSTWALLMVGAVGVGLLAGRRRFRAARPG